uniref:Conserved oligomeric Golgi complex subunit 4 n=2 Tax=Steinernema glaseri TaxID=37863 RepID=A0A1I7Y4U5_9BILA
MRGSTMGDEYHFGSSEARLFQEPLVWKPKSLNVAKNDSQFDIGFDMDAMLVDLRNELEDKQRQEEQISKELSEALENAMKSAEHDDIARSFNSSLNRYSNKMKHLESASTELASNLKTVSGLADNIAERVSALDLAKCRVVDCLQRVSDLRDLRTCSEGVDLAIQEEDYEQAAKHVHRFLTLDMAVFKMGEQIDARDAGQSMTHSYNVLRLAQSTLKNIIERKFDEAVESTDVASMERFFKLFPLINEHQSGLERFGKYLCQKVDRVGEENYKVMVAGGTDDKRVNVLFADSLTMIFEGIARIIEVHQPTINTFYGADKLLLVIEMIQGSCDREIDRIISAFYKSRQYDEKFKLISKYMRSADRNLDLSKVDPLDLDVLLSEVALMHSRAELYWRFLKRRFAEAYAKNDINKSEDVSKVDSFDPEMTESEIQESKERLRKKRLECDQKLEQIVNRSLLGTRMQEIIDKYVMMEQFYVMECMEKAVEIDCTEEGSLTSSVVDDVFFIVRKSIRRALSSSSVDCICAMINYGVTILGGEFLRHVSRAIQTGYPSVGWTAEAYQTAQTAYNVLQHGKTVAEAGPDNQRAQFINAVNNIRSAAESVESLRNTLCEDVKKFLSGITSVENGKIDHSLTQFDELSRTFENSATSAINSLCSAAFKPKLKNSAEAFLDVVHVLSEDELAEYEAVDPFIENFVGKLDKQIVQFERILVAANYQELLSAVCGEVARQLERVVMKCTFNRLGGLQLDKELRHLTNYLTNVAGWMVREKCIRISQIVSLLNIESVNEASDVCEQFQSSSQSLRSLTLSEVKKVLALRSDLPKEQIKSLTM